MNSLIANINIEYIKVISIVSSKCKQKDTNRDYKDLPQTNESATLSEIQKFFTSKQSVSEPR